MKSKINLFWYQHTKGYGNFGDELSPYIIERLTESKVSAFNNNLLNNSKFLNLKILVKRLLDRKLNFSMFLTYLVYDYFRHKKVLYAIGSILYFKNGKNINVWGSGIIKATAEFGEANFIAVRGHYTRRRLKELGYKVPDVVGDPAILLPKIYQPKTTKKHKLGIIPHFIHYEELKKLNDEDIKVINLLDPIEKVIDEIFSCERTLSTSLHGIIVSHAYEIPSLWINFKSKNKLQGDNIKFKDYFSSVGLEEYTSFLIDKASVDLKIIIELFHSNFSLVLPEQKVIHNIQETLINCAPFEVLRNFKYHN